MSHFTYTQAVFDGRERFFAYFCFQLFKHLYMKSTLFTFYLLLVSGFLFAQAPKLNTLLQGKTNFFEIENIAKTYFANKEIKGKGKFEDNEYVRYMRWYWHWKSRVNADGSFP
jgi:hypothetical protein